ncbi:MAG: hypothetical protein WB709_07905, partial [Solirubrobacteraceae bacterium]
LEGRQSGFASDKKHFIESHTPAIELEASSIRDDTTATALLRFKRKKGKQKSVKSALWFLDRDQVTLVPDQGSTVTKELARNKCLIFACG